MLVEFFLDEPSLYIYAGIMLSMNCFFPYENQPWERVWSIEFWDASLLQNPWKSIFELVEILRFRQKEPTAQPEFDDIFF